MTQNAKMRAPKEMATETMRPESPQSGIARARKRMERMVASPAEGMEYCFAPTAARDNSNAAIMCEDYSE